MRPSGVHLGKALPAPMPVALALARGPFLKTPTLEKRD